MDAGVQPTLSFSFGPSQVLCKLPFSGSNPPPHPYLMDSGTPFLLTFNATTIETNSTETNSTSGRG